jgi:hypothetical protein
MSEEVVKLWCDDLRGIDSQIQQRNEATTSSLVVMVMGIHEQERVHQEMSTVCTVSTL